MMRSAQEQHLDQVLTRKQGKQASLDHPVIRSHLNQIDANHVIFILLATPVEEVGRDHDFDWAVVEPSSYRSFIQLAGRVLRHQELTEDICSPNISLLQTNRKGLLGKQIAFNRPGYESGELMLNTHDLKQLLDTNAIATRLDADPRIQRNTVLQPHDKLADLEHEAIHRLLTSYDQQGANTMQDWLTGYWWLTGEPQRQIRFRQSMPQQTLYLVLLDGKWIFCEKDGDGSPIPIEKIDGIEHEENLTERQLERLWLKRDYQALLEAMNKSTLERAALVYGEINITQYENEANPEFAYSAQLGMTRKRRLS
jgi:CRISPR-associated endonuclease/helicase Cas3